MANSQNITAPSRFHNLSDAALADEIGRVDSISKAAEAELKALKDEFKARGFPLSRATPSASQQPNKSPDVSMQRPCATISGRPIRVSKSPSSQR